MPDPNQNPAPGGGDQPPAGGPAAPAAPEWKAPIDALSKGLQEVTETIKNLTALAEAGFAAKPPPGGGDPDPNRPQPSELRLSRKFQEKHGISDEAVAEIIQEAAEHLLPAVEERVANANAIQAERTKLKDGFYKSNPDLTGFEIEVAHFSTQVSQEAVKSRLPLDKQMVETARRTREYLAKRSGGAGGGAPPGVLDPGGPGGGGGGGAGGGAGAPADTLDPTKSIDDEISSRRGSQAGKAW